MGGKDKGQMSTGIETRRESNPKEGTGSIGIDVGGTKTLFGLFDPKFKVVEEVKVKTHDSKNGKLYRGADAIAGDIGHYFVFPAGPRNGFDADSMLDDVASRTAIAGAAATLAAKKLAPQLFKLSGTDVENVTSDALARAIAKGDRRIEKLVRSRCHILGIVLSNLVDFLNPEMIVLGGGLTKAMPAIVRAEVEAAIRAYSTSKATKSLAIVVAKLKGHAVTAGAAKLAIEGFNSKRRP
jgi:glucokinase